MLNVMRYRAISLFIVTICIFALFNGGRVSAETIQGTPDDTSGVYIYTAAAEESAPGACDGAPAGLPTADIIQDALNFDILAFIGDTPEEILGFTSGGDQESNIPGQIDTTQAEIITGLTAIDDFGDLSNGGDDDANFDTGTGGEFYGGFRDPFLVISADGIVADGTLGGPTTATSALEADTNLRGMEIFIFEDSELSGFRLELYSPLNTFIVNFDDFQVNPGALNAADDMLIGIDLDSLPGWDGTYITDMRLTDNGIEQATVDSCRGTGAADQSLEIDAIVARKAVFSNLGSISGNVSEDTNQDSIGDTPITGVTISLLDETGNPVLDIDGTPITTTTDPDGNYLFPDVTPGNYIVVETQPDGYMDVSEVEGGTDSDNPDNGVINSIVVTVAPGEEDSGNDFVEAVLQALAVSLVGQTAGTIPLISVLFALVVLMTIVTTQAYRKSF